MSDIKKFSFVRTFRLKSPFGETVVQIDMEDMSEEQRRHQELLFSAHLTGEALSATADGNDGPAIRNVHVVEVHSIRKEVSCTK